MKITLTDLMSYSPCSEWPKDKIKEVLFEGKEYISIDDVLSTDYISFKLKVWILCREEYCSDLKKVYDFTYSLCLHLVVTDEDKKYFEACERLVQESDISIKAIDFCSLVGERFNKEKQILNIIKENC